MAGVWVSDEDSPLGRRLVRSLVELPGIELATLAECDVAVHLGASDPDARSRRRESVTEGAVAMLDQIGPAGHIVLVSSALVYGAWENNPVPLTEDSVLRPDVDFAYARQLAAVEQLVDAWRTEVPGRTAAVLRPVVTMASDGTTSLARALAAGMGQRFGVDDPPAQFVHLDDLASAVTIAVQRRLDGVFNVAPDGFIPADSVRALSGGAPRLRLPDPMAEVLNSMRWRFQRGPIPPGLSSYTRSPWLVANDRLKATGWHPTVTNEEAYVEGTEAKWWTMVSPKRRQELALASVVAVGGTFLLVVLGRVRRSVRARRGAR